VYGGTAIRQRREASLEQSTLPPTSIRESARHVSRDARVATAPVSARAASPFSVASTSAYATASPVSTAPFVTVSLGESLRDLVTRGLIRAIDVAGASAILVVSAPVILVVTAIIRLDSAGPAIFRQIRVGKDRRPFMFYKFRTFHVDAKERFPELYRYEYTPEEVATMHFKEADDPRATRVGRLLRKTSLDELPNFINVLKGDMTLVGPRPEIPELVRYYEPWQCAKWDVRPGVTGLAQVRGRNSLTLQETIALDVEYVRTRSLRRYFGVLIGTARVVLRGIGAL
jgi:lipopolysaccharide/colanic/teichoic acid biosynthesis glycosyltransferase